MNLMGIDISSQYIVRGAVLAAAVIFDVATRRRAMIRYGAAHCPDADKSSLTR